MASTFLATKLLIPPQTDHVVRRPRLLAALSQAVSGHKLILISAPAGYGKTTLLAHWARESQRPIAWLSLEEEDDEANRFQRYLYRAWESALPALSERPLRLLLSGQAADQQPVLAEFINTANELPVDLVVVLDDIHLIQDPAIHRILVYLLDHAPPQLSFVLAGRGDPPLPIARYRARDEMVELRADDLRFMPDEAADFLKSRENLDLDARQIEALTTKLEGWVTGLQLLSLTLSRQRAVSSQLVISGRHRYIADYLSQDVLAGLADADRHFLLQTSILDRLCGPLCDVVTGRDDSQQMLESLERANLFLMPLDERREWCRYHGLFADFLRDELHRRYPDEVAALHLRAAEWYVAFDLPEPAFEHAIAAANPELVVRIFERYSNHLLHHGELKLMTRWHEAVPQSWYVDYPVFGLFQAALFGIAGAFDDCVRCLDEVEARLAAGETADQQWQLAIVYAVRCFMACVYNDLVRAEMCADRALPGLRDESVAYRASVHHALGDTYRRHGRWADARASYLKVVALPNWPGRRVQTAHIFGSLADLELRQGQLRRAADYWRKALAGIEDETTWGLMPLPVTGWVFIRMGELLYEWNELAAAADHLRRGLERSELGGDMRAMIAGYVLTARLKLAEGDGNAALDYLERARPLVERAPFPEWKSRFERCQVDYWLTEDQQRSAVTWADDLIEGGGLESLPESEALQLGLARVLLTAKRDPRSRVRVLAVLGRQRRAAEADGRTGVQIEALALLALAKWEAGDSAGAMVDLEQSLRLAEPEGYRRLYVDIGPPLVRLLHEARSRRVMPDYIDGLLAIFGDATTPAAHGQSLDSLSGRESEILQLIAAGLTNREIAATLVISPETVKKHTGNIYAKLGVGRRTEAVARARRLALLD